MDEFDVFTVDRIAEMSFENFHMFVFFYFRVSEK